MSWESIFSAGLSDDDAQAWGRLVAELGGLHDVLASMQFDRAAVEGLTAELETWREKLTPLVVEEMDQVNGRVPQLPVRGNAMVPQIRVTSAGGGRVEGTITFGRWFLGGGMAAHGGVVSLMFDEALGILAAVFARSITRTAYLHVDYRALTPLDTELTVRAWIDHDRSEGRKLFVRGELCHGDVVCAEADGLFLRLSPEQGLGRRTTPA